MTSYSQIDIYLLRQRLLCRTKVCYPDAIKTAAPLTFPHLQFGAFELFCQVTNSSQRYKRNYCARRPSRRSTMGHTVLNQINGFMIIKSQPPQQPTDLFSSHQCEGIYGGEQDAATPALWNSFLKSELYHIASSYSSPSSAISRRNPPAKTTSPCICHPLNPQARISLVYPHTQQQH